jgi:V8-like Glu-specific endopeptidase
MHHVRSSIHVTMLLAGAFCLFSGQAFADRIGHENRKSIDDYAKSHKISGADARGMYGATGRIMCPFGESSAFLVDKSNIVVTARHVLYPETAQHSYAGHMQINRCGFEVSVDGKTSKWHKVNVTSFVYPEEKQRSFNDRFDWVVMKLSEPVTEVAPYRLPSAAAHAGEAVTMATIRQKDFTPDDWNTRIIEDCKVKNLKRIDGVAAAGLFTDCSASPGASGGALTRKGPDGIEVVGIQSSGIMKNCEKYNSKSCYSYAVGLSPAVVQAIHNLAGD